MKTSRRAIVVSGLRAALCIALAPATVYAKQRNIQALLGTTDPHKSMQSLLRDTHATVTDSVDFQVPSIAENGNRVRISMKANMPDVEWIGLFVEKNPIPLTCQFLFGGKRVPAITVTIKVKETSNVVAIVKTKAAFFKTSQKVRVVIGGC